MWQQNWIWARSHGFQFNYIWLLVRDPWLFYNKLTPKFLSWIFKEITFSHNQFLFASDWLSMDNTLHSSLLTIGKQSLLPSPHSKPPTLVTIFYEWESKMHHVSMEVEGLTASTVILIALEKLNAIRGVNLPESTEKYELYAAKKNGKRQSDFPAIEGEQFLTNTGIHRFHLKPLKKVSSSSETKESLSTIKSQITMKVEPPKQKLDASSPTVSRIRRFFQCLCLEKWYSFIINFVLPINICPLESILHFSLILDIRKMLSFCLLLSKTIRFWLAFKRIISSHILIRSLVCRFPLSLTEYLEKVDEIDLKPNSNPSFFKE